MSELNVNTEESIATFALVKISTCKSGQVASKSLAVILLQSSTGKLNSGLFKA